MAAPTVGARLARRLIVFCADAAFRDSAVRALPPGWEITFARSVPEVGEFQDVLLHRFVLLDLEAPGALEDIREIRAAMLLNIPIFCFGGDQAARDAARIARADRFFGRDEIASLLPQICESYAW